MHAVRVRYEGNKGPRVNMDIAATINAKTNRSPSTSAGNSARFNGIVENLI